MGFIEQLDESSGREDNGADDDSEDDEMDGFDVVSRFLIIVAIKHS